MTRDEAERKALAQDLAEPGLSPYEWLAVERSRGEWHVERRKQRRRKRLLNWLSRILEAGPP